MGVKYKENFKKFQEVQKKVASMGKSFVKLGVLADAGEDEQLDLVALAVIHEFGVDTDNVYIPERSFIRSTLRQKKDELAKLIASLVRKVIEDKMTEDQALGLLGEWGAAEIKKTIIEKRTEGPDPQENAASTIARKGSSTPLVGLTGQLTDSISYEVASKSDAKD